MKTRKTLGVAAIAALAIGLPTAAASADTIRVQSTTDTIDAGLVDGLLKPAYAQAQPGGTLSYVGVGTGAALVNAENGQVCWRATPPPGPRRGSAAAATSSSCDPRAAPPSPTPPSRERRAPS